MRPAQRLKRRQDFSAVYHGGASFTRGSLVLKVRANPNTAEPRFGFAVGKRLGSAVIRNRVKRRLRAAIDTLQPRGQDDVVVIARASAVQASYQELETTMRGLLGDAGLLNTAAAQ